MSMNTQRNVHDWFSRLRFQGTPLQWRQVLVAAGVWLLATIVFATTLLAQRIDVAAGDLAPRTVVAPYGVVDWGATQKAREQAAKLVPSVYTTNNQILRNQEAALHKDFSLILSLSIDQTAPLDLREQTIAQALPIGLPLSVWGKVLSLSPASLSQLQQDALVIISSAMGNGNGVRNNKVGLAEAQGFAAQLAAQEEQQPSLRLFLADFTKSLIVPNTFLNVQDTAARRQAAMDKVPTVKILKGEEVLQAGQVITPADIKVLQELGLLDQGFNPAPVIGSALLSFVLVALIAGYLWFLRRQTLLSLPATIITGLIFTTSLIGADIVKNLPALSYLVVPTAAIMVTALVDSGLGMVMAGVLALGVATLTGADLNVALVSFFGGLAGVFGVTRLSQRYDIIRAGVLVGIVNLLALAGLDIMQGAALSQATTWETLLWGLLDGILAAVLAMGSIPFLEGPFGIITSMKLIELSNPNQPLLRKLLVEAPGTYHHSIMVGNLAEQATEAVGGNSLLARVGAYYHDIGKSKRPYFFVDNQFGADNPHDKLAPTVSALIISSHVRDGIELARQYHLPDAIVQFIREHHGTTLISFFYHKALAADTGDGVLEEDFRYDGPRPQSKETAIVMLADASEATSRTLKHPTPQTIEQVVRKIIKDRLEDGQLDESNLTLKELDTIARTFTRVLTGMFHQRIEYPESVLKEMERSRGRGNMGGKPPGIIRKIGGHSTRGRHPHA